MSIRWMRNLVVDGQQTTIEVLLGANKIADKCYVRVNGQEEYWFKPSHEGRDAVLQQGIDMLKARFNGHSVQSNTGSPYSWN